MTKNHTQDAFSNKLTARSMFNSKGNRFERKTYGQMLQDRALGEQLRLAESYDFAKVMMATMLEDVNAEIKEHGSGKFKDKTFYVMSIMAIESIGKVPITKTVSLDSCPHPSLNQTVWKIDHDKQDAFLLWHLPSKATANHIINNPNEYLKEGNSKATMTFVEQLRNGTLKRISDRENGFKKDMALILTEDAA